MRFAASGMSGDATGASGLMSEGENSGAWSFPPCSLPISLMDGALAPRVYTKRFPWGAGALSGAPAPPPAAGTPATMATS